ncbi:MAG: PEGA domain-containing protein [Acidobacteriia bacterium]|nr:PEGA domain-containing protein [Terriglobia bacterium]
MPETTGTATPPDATPSSASAAEAAPRSDKMELIQQMPAGSVGVVYQAKNPKLDRVVALRQMQVPDWLDDADDLIKRILAEARSANGLAHPSIAQMLTGGYKGFTVFLSAEFVEGKYLRDHVNSTNPGLPEVMALARQLCAAVDYAHGKQVLHYALNFGNIKVLPDGTLKLLDFGVLRDKNIFAPPPAKRLENEHYLSPEQVKNRPVDRAANMFSLGTIVYELFTTRNPFAGRHLGEVDRNITDVDTIPASSAHSRVPEPVSRVLSKALSKNPAERFSSGEQLIDALEEAMKMPATPRAAATPAAKPSNGTKPAATQAASAAGKAPAPAGGTVFGGTPVNATTFTKPSVGPARSSGPATVALKPAAKPADKAAQWKIVAVILAAVFVVAAIAISLGHRTEVPAPPPEEKPVAAAPKVEAPAAPVEAQPQSQSEEVQRRAVRRSARPEPASAPVPVAEGQLSVSSTPDGATIEIGGRTVDSWKTPQTISSLAPGVYPVKVSKAGFATETRSVEITSGGRAFLDFKLNPLRATLSIGGTPGASIAIDGKPTNRFTPAEFSLDPASHSVTLHKEGYFDFSGDVKLTAGQATSLTPNLTVAGRTDNIKVVGGLKIFGGGSHGMSRLVIKSDPKGAQVTINGSALPKVTPVEVQVEPGNYVVVIQKDGYQPVKKTVVTEANGKVTVDEQLPH